MRRRYPGGTELEFGNFAGGIQRRIGQQIGCRFDITERDKNHAFGHVAVGAGYPDAGNHSVSALHWDMVCDLRPDDTTGRPGGVIEADGEVFWKAKTFVELYK